MLGGKDCAMECGKAEGTGASERRSDAGVVLDQGSERESDRVPGGPPVEGATSRARRRRDAARDEVGREPVDEFGHRAEANAFDENHGGVTQSPHGDLDAEGGETLREAIGDAPSPVSQAPWKSEDDASGVIVMIRGPKQSEHLGETATHVEMVEATDEKRPVGDAETVENGVSDAGVTKCDAEHAGGSGGSRHEQRAPRLDEKQRTF